MKVIQLYKRFESYHQISREEVKALMEVEDGHAIVEAGQEEQHMNDKYNLQRFIENWKAIK